MDSAARRVCRLWQDRRRSACPAGQAALPQCCSGLSQGRLPLFLRLAIASPPHSKVKDRPRLRQSGKARLDRSATRYLLLPGPTSPSKSQVRASPSPCPRRTGSTTARHGSCSSHLGWVSFQENTKDFSEIRRISLPSPAPSPEMLGLSALQPLFGTQIRWTGGGGEPGSPPPLTFSVISETWHEGNPEQKSTCLRATGK